MSISVNDESIKTKITSPIGNDKLKEACQTNFPSPIKTIVPPLTQLEKITQIADKFRQILEILGLDLSDDSLQDTPARIAKMYVEEIFSGLDPSNFPEINFFEDRFQHALRGNMVFVKVNFCSFCEHHFVPMIGVAYVAYVPKEKLIGLSHIAKIVRFFAKRPQVQERLTAQIADSISILTGSETVAASLRAEHHCMIVREIESENSYAITNVLRGEFESNPMRTQEFFNMIPRS